MARNFTARSVILLAWICFGVLPVRAHSEEPIPVTACQLLTDPGRYNHVRVEVTGDVDHGFELFTLGAADCPDADHASGVWLEYGGKKASDTMYCCGVTDTRSRPAMLTVEGFTTQLKDDQTFQAFDRIIQKKSYAKARVTLIGRFFSGERRTFSGGTFWVGYGHMGLFSLLVIEQVLSAKALPVDQ